MFTIGLHATSLLIWGIAIHLFCDWILQNDYLATYKVSLLHPASWIHSGIHFLGLLLIFPWWVALIIAIIHLLIDTRVPLKWWRNFFVQTQGGPVALHVQIWSDQVAHVTALAIAALAIGGLK
jgi:hypothetical protein